MSKKIKVPVIRTIALALLALGLCGVALADPPVRYDSVESYISSMHGSVRRDGMNKGYGELSGRGHRDWAGLVSTKDNNLPKIVVLTQDQDGKYQADLTLQTEGGGTANSFVDGARIIKSSVYVNSSWNWHGCGGGATHQFKYYDGQWRLIGVFFHRSTSFVTTDANGEEVYDVGDSVDIDRNLLTGNVIVKFKARGKKQVIKYVHVAPEVWLFQDYDQEQGSLPQFDQYAQC